MFVDRPSCCSLPTPRVPPPSRIVDREWAVPRKSDDAARRVIARVIQPEADRGPITNHADLGEPRDSSLRARARAEVFAIA